MNIAVERLLAMANQLGRFKESGYMATHYIVYSQNYLLMDYGIRLETRFHIRFLVFKSPISFMEAKTYSKRLPFMNLVYFLMFLFAPFLENPLRGERQGNCPISFDRKC